MVGVRYPIALCAVCFSSVVCLVSFAGNAHGDTYSFLFKWGEFGNGTGQFNNPKGLALDSQGNVYVADSGNNRIQKFNSAGRLPEIWNQETIKVAFNDPSGITIDKEDFVYVSDFGNSRILKFNANGTLAFPPYDYVEEIQSGFQARATAVDNQSNIYIADISDQSKFRVIKLNRDFKFIEQWCSECPKRLEIERPNSIATDGIANVYIAETLDPRIHWVTIDGSHIDYWGNENNRYQFNTDEGPREVYVDSSGNVFASDSGNHQVIQFSSAGEIRSKIGSFCELATKDRCVDPDGPGHLQAGDGQFDYPRGIAFGSQGFLYVSESGNQRIQVFNVTDFSPTAEFSFSDFPKPGKTVTFNGGLTKDDKNGLTYSWNFGDGEPSVYGKTIVNYTFPESKKYDVTLTVTDVRNNIDAVSHELSVKNNEEPIPFFDTLGNRLTDDQIEFVGTFSRDPDGYIQEYIWDFDDETELQRGNTTLHQFKESGTYHVVLTVLDDDMMEKKYERDIEITSSIEILMKSLPFTVALGVGIGIVSSIIFAILDESRFLKFTRKFKKGAPF